MSDHPDSRCVSVSQPVFRAGWRDYLQCRVPGIIAAPDDTILATVEARRAQRSADAMIFGSLVRAGEPANTDWTDNDILISRSHDGGHSWSDPEVLFDHAVIGPGPMHNCCLIADPAHGLVHALVSHDYRRAFACRSSDSGRSWSPLREITPVYEAFRERYWWNVLTTGIGHGLCLRSGRLVVPVWISDAPDGQHEPNRSATLFSDDGGETWTAGELIGDQVPTCNESTAFERAHGGVRLNLRNRSPQRRRAWADSLDGAAGWTPPRLDRQLPDPWCMGSTLRYDFPVDGRPGRVLFANCASDRPDPERPWAGGQRERLTLRLSEDDGATWLRELVLEAGTAGYCDLARAADGAVLCIHESGTFEREDGSGPAIHRIDRIVVARIDPAWLGPGGSGSNPGDET